MFCSEWYECNDRWFAWNNALKRRFVFRAWASLLTAERQNCIRTETVWRVWPLSDALKLLEPGKVWLNCPFDVSQSRLRVVREVILIWVKHPAQWYGMGSRAKFCLTKINKSEGKGDVTGVRVLQLDLWPLDESLQQRWRHFAATRSHRYEAQRQRRYSDHLHETLVRCTRPFQ